MNVNIVTLIAVFKFFHRWVDFVKKEVHHGAKFHTCLKIPIWQLENDHFYRTGFSLFLYMSIFPKQDPDAKCNLNAGKMKSNSQCLTAFVSKKFSSKSNTIV